MSERFGWTNQQINEMTVTQIMDKFGGKRTRTLAEYIAEEGHAPWQVKQQLKQASE